MDIINEINASCSNAEIVGILGLRFRECRLILNILQEDISKQSGVSIATLRKFESGRAYNITLQSLLSLLRCLGMLANIDRLIPEQPENPFRKRRKPRQRANRNNKQINEATGPQKEIIIIPDAHGREINETMSPQKEIIVIPDVHGRDFWREAAMNRGNREVIFLGDYVDPYPWEKISDNQTLEELYEIVKLKQDNPNDITLLLGNHDLQYVYQGFPGARYCRENAFMYFDAFWDHRALFDLAAVRTIGERKFIFSHAGIQPWWFAGVA